MQDHTYMELLDKFQEAQATIGKLEVKIDLVKARVRYMQDYQQIPSDSADSLIELLEK